MHNFAFKGTESCLTLIWTRYRLDPRRCDVFFRQIEVWEAVVTLSLFPLLVGLAYMADRGLPCQAPRVVAENGKQIDLGNIHPGECKLHPFRLAHEHSISASMFCLLP